LPEPSDGDGPRRVTGLGMNIVTSDEMAAICLLNIETPEGIVQYAINEENAYVIAAAMKRYIDALAGER
jgi:hypothetical protein